MEVFTPRQLELMSIINTINDQIHATQHDLSQCEAGVKSRLDDIRYYNDKIAKYNGTIDGHNNKMIEAKEELLKLMWENIVARNPNQTSINDPVVDKSLHVDQIGREE